MFRYELFKLRSVRVLCFLCAALFAADIVLCTCLCKKSITPENSAGVIVSYNSFNGKYETALNKIIENAERNMTGLRYENVPESAFAYRYQKALAEQYAELKEELLTGNHTVKGWDFLLSYRIGETLLYAAVIIFSSYLFALEERTGMLPLLRSCKYGRLRFASVKLFVGICISSALTVLFKSAEFATVCLVTGIRGGAAPLKVLADYFYTTLSMSILSYYLTTAASAIAASVLITLFCAVLSASTFNAPLTVFSGAALLGLNFFLIEAQYGNPLFPLRMLSIVSAVHGGISEQRFYGANLFGYPVPYHIVRITIWIIMIPLLFTAVLMVYNRKNVSIVNLRAAFGKAAGKVGFAEKAPEAGTNPVKGRIVRRTAETAAAFKNKLTLLKTKKRKKTVCRARHTSILFWEVYKISAHRLTIVVPLAAVCVVFAAIAQKAPSIESDEKYYRDHMTKLEGEWTQDKHEDVLMELEKLNSVIRQKSDYDEKFKKREISLTEYSEFLSKYDGAKIIRSSHMRVVNKSEYLKEISENNPEKAWFVYDTGWIAGFKVNNGIIMISAVILLFHDIFGSESVCGFLPVLRCTKKGRKSTAVGKFLTAGLISPVFAALLSAAELITVTALYEFPSGAAPLYSLEMFRDYTGSMSLNQFVLLTTAVKILSVTLLALTVSAVSGIIRAPVVSVAVSLALCGFADLSGVFGFNAFEAFKISNFAAAVPLLLSSFEGQNDYSAFLTSISAFAGAAAVLCYMAYGKWSYGEKT